MKKLGLCVPIFCLVLVGCKSSERMEHSQVSIYGENNQLIAECKTFDMQTKLSTGCVLIGNSTLNDLVNEMVWAQSQQNDRLDTCLGDTKPSETLNIQWRKHVRHY